jgi:hypothetical protein
MCMIAVNAMVFTGYILVTIALCISVVAVAPRIPVGLQELYNSDQFDKKTDNAHPVSPGQNKDPDMKASIEWVL